jgi:hypothetical protein
VLYVEVLRQVKVDQQDFYCYKTLQMQSIHVFKLIQRGQVECPLFPVLGAGSLKLERVFANEQGDAFNRLPIQRG